MRQNINGFVGEITTLPGCSQVGVSHSVFALPDVRGKRFGSATNRHRQETAFGYLAYDYMLCTVESTNLVQKNILTQNGWMFLDQFISRKTGHTVELWGCTKEALV